MSFIIKNINTFNKYNEVLENDITWGGSLLGRFINSFIRKSKIKFNSLRINSIVAEIERELDLLIESNVNDEEMQKEINSIKFKKLIIEIYEIVVSDKYSVSQKKAILLGNKDDGMIDVAIETIEILPVNSLKNKNQLLDKLKKFKELLNNLVDDNSDELANKVLSLLENVVKIIGFYEAENNPSSNTEKTEPSKEAETQTGDEPKKDEDDEQPKKPIVREIDEPKKDEKRPEPIDNDYEDVSGDKDKGNNKKETKLLKPKKPVIRVENGENGEKKFKMVNPDGTTKEMDDDELKKIGVDKSKVKNEGFIYLMNESLSDEYVDIILRKIKLAYKNSALSKIKEKINVLIEKGIEVEKKNYVLIGKQILNNLSTNGKPISYGELIKENSDNLKYHNDEPKAISLFARVVMAIKDDKDALEYFNSENEDIVALIGEFIKKYEDVIEQADIFKNNNKATSAIVTEKYNFLRYIKEEVQKTTQSQAQVQAPQSQTQAQVQAQAQKSNTPSGDIQAQAQSTDKITKDSVSDAWFTIFDEGEQDDYVVSEELIDNISNKIERIVEKPFIIDQDSNIDRIIRIVNLFGKAYNLYANDVIPSGRPNGIVSQKTWREYMYMGKGTPPNYSIDNPSQYGPWYVREIYQKFDSGVMKILEDTKYRKVLANARFKNVGPNQKNAQGKTLAEFMIDMMSSGSEDSNFYEKRKRLMKKYFNITNTSSDSYDGVGKKSIKLMADEKGDVDKLHFIDRKMLSRSVFRAETFSKKEGFSILNEFMLIHYQDVNSKDKAYMLAYLDDTFVNTSKSVDETFLMFKFHKSKNKQSMISSYLSEFIAEKSLNLPDEVVLNANEDIFISATKLGSGSYFNANNTNFMNIPYLNIKDINKNDNDLMKTMEIRIIDIKFLCRLKNEDDGTQTIIPVKVGVKGDRMPDSLPANDIPNLKNKIVKNSAFLKSVFIK